MSGDADPPDPGSRNRDPETGATSIEPATRADAPALRELIADLARTIGATDRLHSTVEDLRHYGFDTAPQFEALLAKAGDTPIGLVLYFFTFSSLRGRRLLAAAAARGRTAGCTHLRLSVDADNAAGRGFYDRLGLRHRHDETIYEIAGDEFERLGRG